MDQGRNSGQGLECHGTFFRFRNQPRASIGRAYRKTGLTIPRRRCPPCEHRLLYDPVVRHVPDAGGSWCLPRNGCMAGVL